MLFSETGIFWYHLVSAVGMLIPFAGFFLAGFLVCLLSTAVLLKPIEHQEAPDTVQMTLKINFH